MKNMIVPALFSALVGVSCSKSATNETAPGETIQLVAAANVPAATVQAFTAEFSGAGGVEWQRNSSSRFTVQFNHSNQRHSAGYDDNGHRSSHSVICSDGPVPQAVLDAFRQLYPGDQVYEWKLRTDGTWRAHLLRSGIKYEATFTASGNLLKFERSA